MAYEDASAGNTLTNLIPTLYMALDKVSRELVGMIPAVTIDPQVARAAIGQTIYSPVAPAATASNISAAPLPPDDGEQAIGNISLAITKSRGVPIRWQGEESMQMNSAGGVGVSKILVDQFTQGMRTLVNEIESDLAGLHIYASRGIVPFDTSLFKTDLADAAFVRKILADNGAPTSDLQMVIGTTEGAYLRKQAKVGDGTDPLARDMMTQGVLINSGGFRIRESAQIKSPTIGTITTGSTVGTAAYSVGDTVLTLASAGSGSIVAGDVITIGTDPNYYVVASGDTQTSDGGTITLAAPGLSVAITGSASPAIAVYKKSNRNMAFDRSAIVLATRMPALPKEGDMASDRTTITDPVSGLSFEVSLYKQYRQVRYEIAVAWGVKVVKVEHLALACG